MENTNDQTPHHHHQQQEEGNFFSNHDEFSLHLSREASFNFRPASMNMAQDFGDIEKLKSQIISKDKIFKEYEALQSQIEELEKENEQYQEEIVELRERVNQGSIIESKGSPNGGNTKSVELVNHYKFLNE